MRLIRDLETDRTDLATVRATIDALAAKCEVERFNAWNHPEPAEGPFEGGVWMEWTDDE